MFLSAKEVSEILGKSLKWVYANKDEIPGMFYLGKAYFWDRDVLLTGLKELATSPKGKARGKLVSKHGLS